MFLTRSFLPPPPFALPIGGHANSFRPVFFSSACASVDLKGRLKIIKLAAFNVCCHQQEQRFGFKDGWRRGGKHQRAKMWVSVKVFSNELQRGHTGSDTDDTQETNTAVKRSKTLRSRRDCYLLRGLLALTRCWLNRKLHREVKAGWKRPWVRKQGRWDEETIIIGETENLWSLEMFREITSLCDRNMFFL